MRISYFLLILVLLTNKGFTQQTMLTDNAEEVIHTGIPSEISNAKLADGFWQNIRMETAKWISARDSLAQLNTALERDANWESTPEKREQRTEYQALIKACDQMIKTNERLLNGQICIRSIDPVP